jgi:hypothetical protein
MSGPVVSLNRAKVPRYLIFPFIFPLLSCSLFINFHSSFSRVNIAMFWREGVAVSKDI